MKTIIPIINFVIFSTVTLSGKEKQIRVLLKKSKDSKSKDFWVLPYNEIADDMSIENSVTNFLDSLTDGEYILMDLGQSSDPELKNNDGNRIIKFTFCVVIPEDKTNLIAKLEKKYFWINLEDNFPKLLDGYQFSQDICKSYIRIGSELKGVELIETILEFLPNKFKSRDAEQVALLFGKERRDMFIFFRYLKEQSNPEKSVTNRLHLRVGQKIRDTGEVEIIGRGKPAILYEKLN